MIGMPSSTSICNLVQQPTGCSAGEMLRHMLLLLPGWPVEGTVADLAGFCWLQAMAKNTHPGHSQARQNSAEMSRSALHPKQTQAGNHLRKMLLKNHVLSSGLVGAQLLAWRVFASCWPHLKPGSAMPRQGVWPLAAAGSASEALKASRLGMTPGSASYTKIVPASLATGLLFYKKKTHLFSAQGIKSAAKFGHCMLIMHLLGHSDLKDRASNWVDCNKLLKHLGA